MHNNNLKQLNNTRHLVAEKAHAVSLFKKLSVQYKQSRNSVSDLYYEVNKKEIMLDDETLDVSQKSMLIYDVSLTQRELEKAIHHKEVLIKDVTLLQKRIKHLENEIRKTQPWWQRLFDSIQ